MSLYFLFLLFFHGRNGISLQRTTRRTCLFCFFCKKKSFVADRVPGYSRESLRKLLSTKRVSEAYLRTVCERFEQEDGFVSRKKEYDATLISLDRTRFIIDQSMYDKRRRCAFEDDPPLFLFFSPFLSFTSFSLPAHFFPSAPGAPILIPEECSAENNSVTVAWQPPPGHGIVGCAGQRGPAIEGYLLELDDGCGGEFRVNLDFLEGTSMFSIDCTFIYIYMYRVNSNHSAKRKVGSIRKGSIQPN